MLYTDKQSRDIDVVTSTEQKKSYSIQVFTR
jgi:hypothetical protein